MKIHHTIARTAFITLALTVSTACDFSGFVPETAADAGSESARIEVRLGTSGAQTVHAAVEGVAVDVVDVLLRRSSDEAWLVLNTETLELDMLVMPGSADFEAVPLALGEYDAVMVTLKEGRVASGGQWRVAELPSTVFEVETPLYLDTTSRLTIDFSLVNAIYGDSASGWILEPELVIGTESIE